MVLACSSCWSSLAMPCAAALRQELGTSGDLESSCDPSSMPFDAQEAIATARAGKICKEYCAGYGPRTEGAPSMFFGAVGGVEPASWFDCRVPFFSPFSSCSTSTVYVPCSSDSLVYMMHFSS